MGSGSAPAPPSAIANRQSPISSGVSCAHPNSSEYVAASTQVQLDRRIRRFLGRFERACPVLLRKVEEARMLFTIAVILLVLWLLGLVSGYTLGNFIYVLLVIALVLFVVGLVSGRRTV